MVSLIKYGILFCFMLILLSACSKKAYEALYPTLNDGKYDTEFPYRNCADQLDEISKSVKKLFVMIDYSVYSFDYEQNISLADLQGLAADTLLSLSSSLSYKNEANSGTATIIQYDDSRIALLSCAHIVSFPDTVYTYFDDNDYNTVDPVQGIAIKTRQRNFFRGHEHGNNLEILAIDREQDIAFIGKEIHKADLVMQPFHYPMGDSDQLEWGSFVYVMGFPLGYQMITRGIVSRPIHGKEGSFLIDASFNEGFSGGIVLAIRDGVPNFELVGLGKSASATLENILVPAKNQHEMVYNPNIPYEDEVYVNLKKNVNYGITTAVSTKAIRKFYRKNKNEFLEMGYDFSKFFEAETRE